MFRSEPRARLAFSMVAGTNWYADLLSLIYASLTGILASTATSSMVPQYLPQSSIHGQAIPHSMLPPSRPVSATNAMETYRTSISRSPDPISSQYNTPAHTMPTAPPASSYAQYQPANSEFRDTNALEFNGRLLSSSRYVDCLRCTGFQLHMDPIPLPVSRIFFGFTALVIAGIRRPVCTTK